MWAIPYKADDPPAWLIDLCLLLGGVVLIAWLVLEFWSLSKKYRWRVIEWVKGRPQRGDGESDTTQKAERPTRHYSPEDKDEISNAVSYLRKIIDNDVEDLRNEFRKFQVPWLHDPRRQYDKPVNIDGALQHLSKVREKASRLNHVIFKEWLDKYSVDKDLLKGALGRPLAPNPFQELYQGADRLKVTLESLKETYEAARDKRAETARVMNSLIEPLAQINAKVGGWSVETGKRLKEIEQEHLTKG